MDLTPLESALSRIGEVRHFIKEAETHYFDPELFRINLNAAIQSSRNVTFAVQSQKSKITNFDAWYATWQMGMKAQPLLKWLVEARNKIVKQGDLKINSILRVGLILSYYDIPQQEFKVPIDYSIKRILRRVNPPSLPREILENAYLRIERRWVENDLADREVLTILNYGLAVLEALLDDLKRHISNSTHAAVYFSDPPSKDPIFNPKILLIRLKDGSLAGEFARREIPPTENAKQRVLERYGPLPAPPTEPTGESSLLEISKYFMEYATRVLSKDGHHMSLAFLISDGNKAELVGMSPQDNAEKYLLWRKLADDVRRTGATKIIAISEIWLASFDKDSPFRRPVDAPNKEEALHILAASKDGTVISLLKKFYRNNTEFVFDETVITNDGKAYLLEPIREVWGLPKFKNPQDPNTTE